VANFPSITVERKLRLAVLISGAGTTLRNLIDKIAAGQLRAEIAAVVSSTAEAKGLLHAAAASLPVSVVDPKSFATSADFSAAVFDRCRSAKTDLVVMGGWLKLLAIPPDYAGRVVNIHPALIPTFCGKGMYGPRVHEAVLSAGAKVSGCTVHVVDDHYDHGPIIAQRAVPVLDGDTPDSLAARVFAVECELYPQVINWIADGLFHVPDLSGQDGEI
jgi:formyltetrahydrofolate-dependent phosphoribosylglycinamide formyltransferase